MEVERQKISVLHAGQGHIFGDIHSDLGLEMVIKKFLEDSKSLDPVDITVTASEGNITLSGTVKSEEQKNAAASITELIQGVESIDNDLIVKVNEGILPTDVGRDD